MKQLPIDTQRTKNFFESLAENDNLKVKQSSGMSKDYSDGFKEMLKKTLIGFGLLGVVVAFAVISNIATTKIDIDGPKFEKMNKEQTIQENTNLEMNKKNPNKYLVALEQTHMNLKYMSIKDRHDYKAIEALLTTVQSGYHSPDLRQFAVDLNREMNKLQSVADVTNKKDKIYAIGEALNIMRDNISDVKEKTLNLNDPHVRKLLSDKEISKLLKTNNIAELMQNEDVKDYLAGKNPEALVKMNKINAIPLNISDIMSEYKKLNPIPSQQEEKGFVEIVLPSKDKIKRNLNKFIEEQNKDMEEYMNVAKDFIGIKK